MRAKDILNTQKGVFEMEVNIESVMNEIRAEIKEKGYTSDMLSFKEVVSVTPVATGTPSLEDLHGAIVYLNDSYYILESIPVTGNIFVRFIKKILRKLLRFYVKPIVMSQNDFNALCVRAFNDLNAYVSEASKTNMSELENKLNILELKVKTVTKENELLAERISELEGKQK